MDRIDMNTLKKGEVNLGVCAIRLLVPLSFTNEFILDIHHGRPVQGWCRYWCG